MKAMSDYTIYCTEEQTRKALELGAPIDFKYHKVHYLDGGYSFEIEEKDGEPVLETPTAEEMIGWLRENDLYINIIHISAGYTSWIKTIKENITLSEENTGFVKSFKEATLAAIDAALEYLINNKK